MSPLDWILQGKETIHLCVPSMWQRVTGEIPDEWMDDQKECSCGSELGVVAVRTERSVGVKEIERTDLTGGYKWQTEQNGKIGLGFWAQWQEEH